MLETCVFSRLSVNQRKILSAVSASLGCMVGGIMQGYPSSALLSLQAVNGTESYLVIDPSQASWFNSLLALGLFIGSVSIGPLFTLLGRKHTLLFVCGPGFVIGWLIVALAQDVAMLYIGRIIVSASLGINFSGAAIYIVETCDTNTRGILTSLPELMSITGISISYIMGTFLKWRHLAFGATLFSIPFILLMNVVPKSPYWLLQKGQRAEANDVLIHLRGSEVEARKALVKIERQLAKMNHGITGGFRSVLDPPIMRAFIVSLGLMFFQRFAGINAVTSNSVDIFQEASCTKDSHISCMVNSNVSAIIISVVQLIFTIISVSMIERAGRRLLLSLSSVLMTVSLISLGTYFYLKDVYHSVSIVNWIPLVCLVVYMAGYGIGYGSIPWVLSAELLPQSVRVAMSPIAAAVNSIFVFIVTFNFRPMQDTMHPYGCFWFYGGVCAVGIIFDLVSFPETKGKSFEEIQEFYGAKRRPSIPAIAFTMSETFELQ